MVIKFDLLFRKEIVIRNLLVSLYIIFAIQSYPFIYNDWISKGCQLGCTAIGFVYLLRCVFFIHKKQPLINTFLAIFFFLQITSFIFYPQEVASVRLGNVSTLNMMKQVCMTILCFFPFYFWTQKNMITDQFILKLTLLLFVLGIIRFGYIEQSLVSLGDEVTNNVAYTFVYLSIAFPLFFKHNIKLGLLLLGVSLILIMYGSKRGAIGCYAVVLILFAFYYVKNHRSKFLSIFVLGVMLLGTSFMVYREYTNNTYLQERIVETIEGNDSGRGSIYTQLWDNWSQNRSISQQLFGKGMAQTINVAGNYAHNDWLELLTNNGLLGVGVYLLFFLSAYIHIKKSPLIGFDRCMAYACILVLFMVSIFSMGYTGNYFCFLMLGTMIGKSENIKWQAKKRTYWKKLL